MLGTLRWNFSLAFIGFALTFIVSIIKNPLLITCTRGLYAFLAFFVLGFLIRILARLTLPPAPDTSEFSAINESGVGEHVNVVTPDHDEDLNDLLKSGLKGHELEADEEGFQPLKPPSLLSTQNKDSQELAQIVQHWNSQDE